MTPEARFAAIYEEFHPEVAAYVRRRSSADDVEDLVASVFLTVWRKIEEAPLDYALPWLYRISYLTLRNHWRKRDRSRSGVAKLESLGVSSDPTVADQVVIREELRDVLAAAERLRKADQELLRLSSWERLDHNEIAAILNIEPNAVRQRLYRARKNLEREFQKISRPTPTARKGGE